MFSLPLLWVLTATPLRPIAITVDDLPIADSSLHADPAERAAITEGLIAALRKHHIPAVGLVVGKNMGTDGEALLKRWLDAGFELGNHSFSHWDLSTTDEVAFQADVERERDALSKLLAARGKTLRYFRFPFLDEGDTLEKLRAMREYLAKTKQQNLTVTLDDQDWSFEKPFVEAKRNHDGPALAQVIDDYRSALHTDIEHFEARGDRVAGRQTPQILLLHANAIGADQWDELFSWLERTGHRFAPVDEVLADPSLAISQEYVGPKGPSYWERVLDGRARDKARVEVTALLASQVAAWNRGDLEAFTSTYADDATFISPRGLTQGRAQVLARYKARYPNSAAMGKLTFEPIEIRLAKGTEFSVFGDALPSRVHGVSVVARWNLERAGKAPASGSTLLVLERRGAGWVVVQDASM